MVHVPDSILTVQDFASHVARLLELNLHGGNAEPPQILLDGFLVPHDEEVREVLRDDEVIDVEPAEPGKAAIPGIGSKRPPAVAGEGPGKRAKVAPVMALGWQADAKPKAPPRTEDSSSEASEPPNGHAQKPKARSSPAVEKAKALALATCGGSPPASSAGVTEGQGIFVGGLAFSVDDRELRKHFEQFGAVQEATVVMNQRTGKSKGFGFVEFRDAGIREKVMAESIEIHGKPVEVKPRTTRGKGGGKEGKGGKDAGKGKEGKGGKDAGKGKDGKSGKGKAKAPTVRQQSPEDDSSEEEKPAPKKAGKPKAAENEEEEEEMTEEMKQMAALGLPVSFKASEQLGGDSGEDDDEEEDDDE